MRSTGRQSQRLPRQRTTTSDPVYRRRQNPTVAGTYQAQIIHPTTHFHCLRDQPQLRMKTFRLHQFCSKIRLHPHLRDCTQKSFAKSVGNAVWSSQGSNYRVGRITVAEPTVSIQRLKLPNYLLGKYSIFAIHLGWLNQITQIIIIRYHLTP